jgi:glucose-6-phosphate dehydrogenase assembly protein OpcA
MTANATEAGAGQAVPVPLRDVERELSRQLKMFQGHKEAPVQRVRMSNLVVFCDNPDTATLVAAHIPEVVAVHPARVLLLISDEETPSSDITASVRVRCIAGCKNLRAFSEEVTLRAGSAAVPRLPFAVRALLVGDLPTNVWWETITPPPLAGPFLYDLAERAQQIIYDSLGWLEPARGVAATATWLEQVDREASTQGWRVASDLNWRRLKHWRRLVSQALDPASAPGAVESITELLIEHCPHAVIQAWELASWLSQRLGWQVLTGRVQPGVEISWRFQAEHGDVRVRIKRLDQGPPIIRRVRIACKLEGQPGALNLVAEDKNRLSVVLEGVEAAPRTIVVPPQTPSDLIGRQLSDREPDPVFRESMSVAQVLAQSILGR